MKQGGLLVFLIQPLCQVKCSMNKNFKVLRTLLLIKDLLIAQGTTQYSVMAYMGKESKKEWIYG